MHDSSTAKITHLTLKFGFVKLPVYATGIYFSDKQNSN